MLLASELGVSLAILIQISFGQSTVSSNYYQQISIEVSTWNDITAPHTLAGLELLLITSFHEAFFNENTLQSQILRNEMCSLVRS